MSGVILVSEALSHVEPASHEVEGNLLFTESELKPYYGLHAITKGVNYGEATEGEFELDGETWTVELRPKSSGLAPWDVESFKFETVKEFTVSVRPAASEDDASDQRKATFVISPRWPGLESLGEWSAPSVPEGVIGVNVRFSGSNLAIDDYPTLLRQAMASVDINAGYFEDVHEFSNIGTFERYVRVSREKSRALIGQGGIFERVWEHVGASEGSFRELREDDRGAVGYHHQVRFDSGGSEALLDGHVLGKQLKHYHPKHVRSEGSDDPLAHPKFGVCFKKGLTSGDAAPWVTSGGSVRWDDRERLAELDEALINVVSWSGLTVRADYRTFVADSHFEGVETEESELTLIDNPLPEIQREQGDVVVSSLTESMPSDREVLTVMADGGSRSVDALAEESGYSTRTVYRVVERLQDIIETSVGTVRFKSQYLRERASETLRTVRDALESEDDSKSVWSMLTAKYGIEVDDRRDERLVLWLGEVPSGRAVSELLQELYHAWQGSSHRFETARFKFEKDGFRQVQTGYSSR